MKITAIHLNGTEFMNYKIESGILNNISRINIFIGENNSGKSRFLRELIKSESNKYNFSFDIKYNNIPSELSELIKNETNTFKTQKNRFETYSNDHLKNNIHFNYINLIQSEINENKRLLKIYNDLNAYIRMHDISTLEKNQINNLIEKVKTLANNIYEERYLKTVKLYSPILRGYRPKYIDENKSDKYTHKEQILREYFFDKKSNSYSKNISEAEIETNEYFYSTLVNNLLSVRHNREKINLFENFLSKTFFSNDLVSLTPIRERNDTLEKIIRIQIGKNEKELYNVGDGISNIINILFPLFMRRDEVVYSFIEEPEVHLHPGMQRILIESLLNEEYLPNFQFFITTHSNHFLDLAFEYPEDISIFHFKKKPDRDYFHITQTKPSDLNILNSLGVRNSSVFLSNCTIWVEGITDRLYLKKYIELYQKTKDQIFHEDLHYSFLEYAGTNLYHYDFADKDPKETIFAPSISNRLLLIADSDEAEGEEKIAKQKLHEKLEKELKDNFCRLPVKEIENTLTVGIVTKTLQTTDSGKDNIKLKKGVDITSEIKIGIGSYITNSFSGLQRTYINKKSKNKSQTISSTYKTEFCKNAITHMHSFDDLSPVAQKLAIKVYDFIKEHNSK